MSEFHPGDHLDHYRIEGLVARSGMASIFRGTDERNGRAVAIKLPHPEMEADPVLFDRFNREEEIGKKLDHPGVVKVFNDEERSRRYMVLEWVDGRLLRQILNEQKKFLPDRAVRITLALCNALDYIHSQGVVHRDLKPENIMLSENDAVKLIDFGISAGEGMRRLTFSKLSNALGTPDYISPEQIKRKHNDGRSDVYALGVILFEMLTGQTPFSGPSPFAVMNDRLVNDPPSPRDINPEISVQMQEILYRAMERDPEDRFSSARAFAEALEYPEQVEVTDRSARKPCARRNTPLTLLLKRILSYTMSW
jgi:serine/threonine-protein kinase